MPVVNDIEVFSADEIEVFPADEIEVFPVGSDDVEQRGVPILASEEGSSERAVIDLATQERRELRQVFQETSEEMGKPMIPVSPRDILQVSPVLSVLPEDVGHGIAEGAANVVSSLTTPQNVMLAGAAVLQPEVAAAYFGVEGAKALGGSLGEASVAAEMGNTKEAARLTTEGVAAGTMMLAPIQAARARIGRVSAEPGAVPPLMPAAEAALEAARVDRTVREGMRPSPEALSIPSELRRPNELQLSEAPKTETAGEVGPSWNLPREIKIEVDKGVRDALEKYQLAKQRKSERVDRASGGKLESSGETFSGLEKTPGFLETAEQRIAKKPSPSEPTADVPEITTSTPLKDVETIVRDKLEQRDWASAVSVLGQVKAEASPKIINKLLGIGKESVPLTAAERTIFNEIWNRAAQKAGVEQAITIEPPNLIQRLESLKTPLTPGVGANPFPEIAKAVWNTSLDIAINAVKAGQHIKVGIDAAMAHMKKNASGFDEASVRQYLSDIIQRETTPAVAKAETSIDAKRPAMVPPPTAERILRPLGEPYSEPIVERVGRLGKGPVSRKVSSEALQIVDRAKRYVGELSVNGLDTAKKAAGSLGRDTTWMNDVTKITDRAAVGHLHEALEGRARTGAMDHIPEHARELTDTIWNANLAIGRLAEKASPGFKASGEAQRLLTSYGMDVIRRGGGPAWEAWAEGLSKANDISVAKAKALFRRWKQELDAPSFDTASLDRISQDFKRTFPKVVTHIKPRSGWHEVIHSSPFKYLDQSSQRTAHAAAFREVYAPIRNPETGKMESSGLLNSTRKAVMREMETDKHAGEFDQLMRALQGHPVDSFSQWWNAPDTPIGATTRALNDAMAPLFSAMLSSTSFRNIGETLSGGAQIFMGYGRAMGAAVKERKLYSDLERSGMVNRAILDFSFDPTSPMRSVSRITSNTIRKGFAEQISNEFQEFVGAAAARVIANEIRDGRLPKGDIQNVIATMRAMGIPDAEAKAAVAGRNEAAVQQFETKAAEFLFGGNRAVAEASPLGASRAFTSLFKWHSYPMTKLRQGRSLINNLIESLDKKDAPQVYANAKLIAKHFGGTVMAGALTYGIMDLIYSGTYGAGIRANEAQSDFPGFIMDSYTMAMGGPVAMAAKMMEEGGDLSSWAASLINASAPVSVANDVSRMVLGMGQYEGLNSFERVGQFLESKTPFARAIRRGMAVAELSNDNPDLDTAIRGFRRWRKDKFGSTRFESHLVDDYDNATFRGHMKKAVNALQKGDEEGYQEEIEKAMQVEDVTTKKVKASLRGRKVLRRPKGERLTEEDETELTNIIGDKGIELLRDFDAMLDHL